MSDSHQYPNLPQATWSCWQTNLVPYLTSQGCQNVRFSGGDSGTLSFHHPVPLSGGNFTFDYSYDSSAQTLTLTIVDSPGDIPDFEIFSHAGTRLYTCPPPQ